MSISFAAPPRIVRDVSPPAVLLSNQSNLPSALTGSAASASSMRRDRHDSHSSMRSSRSTDTTGRRVRSPEPVKYQKKRVSFSTLDNEDASLISYTLKTRHEAYRFTRRSRSFIIGYNDDEYSRSAMEWLVDTMVDDGDEIIALRVIEPSKVSSSLMKASLRSLEVALSNDDTEEKFRQQAKQMQHDIIKMNEEDKELSVVVELAVGNIKLLLLRLMHLYHPDSLIVGTKGRSLNGISGLKPNSISKWCLQNSPVPVIVVRPDRKRDKAKQKRMQDPSRRSYLEILEKSSSFEDLTKAFSTQALDPASESRTERITQGSLEVPTTSSSTPRHGRSMSGQADKEAPRGKSPLGRLGQRVTRVFGDS